MSVEFDSETRRAIQRTEQHLARLCDYFLPSEPGKPSKFEQARTALPIPVVIDNRPSE